MFKTSITTLNSCNKNVNIDIDVYLLAIFSMVFSMTLFTFLGKRGLGLGTVTEEILLFPYRYILIYNKTLITKLAFQNNYSWYPDEQKFISSWIFIQFIVFDLVLVWWFSQVSKGKHSSEQSSNIFTYFSHILLCNLLSVLLRPNFEQPVDTAQDIIDKNMTIFREGVWCNWSIFHFFL